MRGVVFAGTAVTRPESIGSLYRLEHGSSWSAVEGIPLDASVQAITPHPTQSDVLYVATRKGVFRSDDAGMRWSKLNLPTEGVQFWSFAIHPKHHNVMFVGTGPVGFFRSDDAGASWRRCDCEYPERFKITFGSSRAMKVAFHPTDDNIMYAAAEINGFLVSTDAGESWRGANKGVLEFARIPAFHSHEVTDDDTEGMFDAHAVCTTPAQPDTAFYVCRLGIFATADLGEHLRDLNVRRFAPFRYTRDVRVAADDPRTLYACFSIASRSETGAMYRSTDLGETWARVDSTQTVKSTIMGFGVHVSEGGGVASVTRHGQVFYTMDRAESWCEAQLPSNAGDAFCAAII